MERLNIKKYFKIVGYIGFGIFIFVLVVALKFPIINLKGVILQEATNLTGISIDTKKMDLGLFFPSIKMEGVEVSFPAPYSMYSLNFKFVKIKPSILGLLMFSKKSGSVYLDGLGGTIDSGFDISDTNMSIDLTINEINTKYIEILKKFIPFSMNTKISFSGDINIENQGFQTAAGKGELSLKDFIVDEQSLYGIKLPKTKVSELILKYTITKGLLNIDKGVLGKSGDDIEGIISGSITLAEILSTSKLDLKLKLRFSKTFEDALGFMSTMLGKKSSEGFYSMKLVGTLGLPVPTP